MPQARVASFETLQMLQRALVRFEEQTVAAIESARQDVTRALDWIDHEQPHYWREQVRRAFDRVAAARVALEVCRNQVVAGRRPQCIDEQVALARAKARLELCQQKLEVTRRCSIRLHQEADDFRGRMTPLSDATETQLPAMRALLERMLVSLEAYADITRENVIPPHGDTPQEGQPTEQGAATSAVPESQATDALPPKDRP